MNKNITTIDNKQGQSLSVVGDTYRVLISGEQTGGNYAVIDMLVPPGGGPGPHAHKNMQEMFYVVDGEIDFKKEDGNFISKVLSGKTIIVLWMFIMKTTDLCFCI